MWQRTFLGEIRRLDPERDFLRIVYLDAYHEFPWDMARSLELALFHAFAVPRMSALLDRTGEFGRRPQKRYDDTDLLLNEILEHGFDSERGSAAIRRMNALHGRYAIANEDFLYLMSCFVLVPLEWNARFGWRPADENEKLAGYFYWRALGGRMNIRSIPPSLEALRQFKREYERANVRYADSNRRVADPPIASMLGKLLPRALHPLGRSALCALMDDPLREAFGFPAPPAALRRLIEASLRARARMMRFLPERRRPQLRTPRRRRTYPRQYEISKLGPGDAP